LDSTINNEESIRRYLLGQLNEDEQTRIEELYFEDGETFALLQAIEGELIDHYLRLQLSEKDRQDFENCFLQSAERHKRLEFALALKLYAEKAAATGFLTEPLAAEHVPLEVGKVDKSIPLAKPSPKKSFLDFLRFRPIYLLPVAASLILTFGFIFLLIESARLRNQLAEAQQTNYETQQQSQALKDELNKERARAAELAKELEATHSQQNPEPGNGTVTQNPLSQIVAITLSAGAVRGGGGIDKATVSASTETLQLRMEYPAGDFNKVNASLKRVGSQAVVSNAELTTKAYGSKGRSVWSLAAKQLGEGDFIVTLSGVNAAGETAELASFAFRVIKK
jgi:hypothetical protein